MPAKKFDEQDVMDIIDNCYAFDDDQLGFVDFLEAIVRVTLAYPFTEEELADMVSFEMKVMFFVQRMEGKYKSLADAWAKKMMHPEGDDLNYRPRVVLDEDDDEDFDMDG